MSIHYSTVFELTGNIFGETFPRNEHVVAAKHMPVFFHHPWKSRSSSTKGCQTHPESPYNNFMCSLIQTNMP